MRHYVFGGDRYYPQGGANDSLASFADVYAAVSFAEGFLFAKGEMGWAHVWSVGTGLDPAHDIVWENGQWVQVKPKEKK